MNIIEITTFFGWCTILNVGFYLFSAFFIIFFKNMTIKLHHKLIGIETSKLPLLYFTYLGNYKLT